MLQARIRSRLHTAGYLAVGAAGGVHVDPESDAEESLARHEHARGLVVGLPVVVGLHLQEDEGAIVSFPEGALLEAVLGLEAEGADV